MFNTRKFNDYVTPGPTLNNKVDDQQQEKKGDSLSSEIESESNSDATQTKDNISTHEFQIRFFFKPILCAHCRDYIWGEGYVGYGCMSCGICVHSKCKLFTTSSNAFSHLYKCEIEKKVSLEAITRSNIYSIENWSIDIVKQWLAVVNLHRYAEVFATYKINGVQLLSLDIYQLYAFRIRDTYHHAAILQARDELIFRSKHCSADFNQMLKEEEQTEAHLKKYPYKADHHHFLLHTISKLTDCDMCSRPLLGIIHQALRCQECGLAVHRSCASTGLPVCKANNMQMVMLTKHHLFGVSLFDLYSSQMDDGSSKSNELHDNSETKSQVPLLLIKAFNTIEERAYINFEDLYDVYRLSSDTTKIDEIKQQLNENGIELTNFEQYDLNTIAAIVKTFLRDLQDTVIPEAMYEKLIDSIQSSTTSELRNLIKTQLHPLHYNCLSFIMKHLIKVWDYQFKVRGCHYLPDKLFHIFRSILIRPPWEKIYQIVFNIDKQALVIQRLVLECDWGIELPEYKIRPKRPISESLEHTPNFVEENVFNKSASKSFVLRRNSPSKSENKQNNTQEILASSLSDVPWFWGNINRDDTLLILKNCQDGSFLVRHSTEKNINSPFTLCVMKGTLVKSIKIFRQDLGVSNYLYDIEKPCRFESIQALINYYSKVSLKEYNHNLDLVLSYGVSKFKFGKTTEWSIDKLYSSFRDAFEQHTQFTKKFEGLEAEISNIREDLNQKRMASEAFDKIIIMYENQIKQLDKTLTENLLKKTNALSSTRLLASQILPTSFAIQNKSANYDVNEEEVAQVEKVINENKLKIKSRIKDLISKKEELKSDIDYLKTVVGQLQEELDMMRPELIEIRKKRENYHMWLIQRGENDDRIQNVMKSSETILEDFDKVSKIPFNSNSKNQSLHSNSLNWYSAECDRNKAIEILQSKEDGTYLVRLSSQPSFKYVLSVVVQNSIKHLPIEENQSGCFLKSSHKRLAQRIGVSSSNSNSRSTSPSSTTLTGSNENFLKASESMSSINSLNSRIFNKSEESILSKSNASSQESIVKFKTLTDLIVFYSENYLKADNIYLETKLLNPAFL